VHTVRGTSGNVHDVSEGNSLLHGQETYAYGDAGYQGIEKRPDAQADVSWHIAMRPGKRRALNKENAVDAMMAKIEKIKAGIWVKVEHPFRVIKRQFGYVKVRYCGLTKNTASSWKNVRAIPSIENCQLAALIGGVWFRPSLSLSPQVFKA